MLRTLLCLLILTLSTACAPTKQKQASYDIPSAGYTKVIPLSFNNTWESLLNHLSSNYTIEHIDTTFATITASYKSEKPKNIIECGRLYNVGALQDGSPFSYSFEAEESPIYTILEYEDQYYYTTRNLGLEASIVVQISEVDASNTSVNIIIQYTLHKYEKYRLMEDSYNNDPINGVQQESVTFNQEQVATFSPDNLELIAKYHEEQKQKYSISTGQEAETGASNTNPSPTDSQNISPVQEALESLNSKQQDVIQDLLIDPIEASEVSVEEKKEQNKQILETNVYYSPPLVLLPHEEAESNHMICIANNKIEENIIAHLK